MTSLIISPEATDNFLRIYGIDARFSEGELRHLSGAQPEERRGFVSFPTPSDNGRLSILGMRQCLGVEAGQRRCIFFDHPWYLDEAFATIPCRPGWHTIAAAPLADSLDQPVGYADNLAPQGLALPTASEVALMLFLALGVANERLLLRKHTWTQDRTRARRFVSVGAFGVKGLFVSAHEAGYRSRGLGLCPASDPGW